MLDLSGLGLEKENKTKLDLSGLGLEKESSFIDSAKNVVNKVGNSVGGSLFDSVGAIKSMANNVADTVTRPAIDSAPTVGDMVDKTVNPVTVGKKITDISTIKQQPQNKVVPTLRAREQKDDNMDYNFLQKNNPEYALSTEDKINIDRQGLIEQDPLSMFIFPGTAISKGVLTKVGAGLFEGLLQAKSAIVRGVKGEQFNPFEREGVAELIPDDYPSALKFAASLGEMVVDGVIAGNTERAVTNKLIVNTGDFFRRTLLKKGYTQEQADKVVDKYKNYVIKRQTGMTQDQMINASKNAKPKVDNGSGVESFESNGINNGVIEQPRPISSDEALKMNIQARTATIPEAPKQPLKADTTIKPEQESTTFVGAGGQQQNDVSIMPIKQKWDSANKVVGSSDIQNYGGQNISGKYMLVEAGVPTASHNPFRSFAPTENFPTTSEGKTVNDRDYFNDKQAQQIVVDVANKYDQRALQDVPVVTNDGIVVSGNQRTMASQIAANNNTDTDYINYLKNYSSKYGFSPEQVAQFQHPRVVFVPDNKIDYTTENFALFNQQNTKTQNSLEQAVSLGKRLDKNAIDRINSVIGQYESLSDLYNNPGASSSLVRELIANKIVSLNDLPRYTVNTGNGYILSEAGKEFLENVLVGSAVSEDSLRAMATIRNVKQKIIKNLYEITDNNSLPDSYNLKNEISSAIKMLAQMRAGGFKTVDSFLAQIDMFNREWTDEEVQIAKLIDDSYLKFKRFLQVYNESAKQAVEDMSVGGGLLGESPKTKLETMQFAIKGAFGNEEQSLLNLADVESEVGSNIVNENNFSDIASSIADKYSKKDMKSVDINTIKKDINTLEKVQYIVDNSKPLFVVKDNALIINTKKEYDTNDLNTIYNLAKEYYNQNMRPQELIRDNIKGTIRFSGREKFLSTNYRNINGLKLMPYIIPIIKQGKLSKFSPLKPDDRRYELKKSKGVKGYYFITAILQQNGKNKLSAVSLEVDNKGNFFYNLISDFVAYQEKKLRAAGDLSLLERATAPSNDIITQNSKNGNTNLSSISTHGVQFTSEPGDKVSGNSDKLYQRSYDLAHKFGVNIGESKYRPRNAVGVYFNYGSKKGNVYVNSLLNIATVVHEVVHALDDRNDIIRRIIVLASLNGSIKFSKNNNVNVAKININKVLNQLRDCSIRFYGLRSMSVKPMDFQAIEGITTMIQMAVVDPNFIKTKYPEAFSYLMQVPVLKDLYKSARQIIVDYEAKSAVQKLTNEIYDTPLKTVKKKVPLLVRLDRQFFDSEAPLRWLDEDLYLTAKGYKTILRGIIENNLANKDGMMYVINSNGEPVERHIGDNWKTFINTVTNLNSNFNEYLVARRFIAWYEKIEEYKEQIIQLNDQIYDIQQQLELNPNDVKLIKQLNKYVTAKNIVVQKHDKLVSVVNNHRKDRQVIEDGFLALDNETNRYLAQQYDSLMACSLDTLYNSGVINFETYNELSNNYGYAPFRKQQYDDIVGDVEGFYTSNKNKIGELKEITGSELAIVSPLYSSVHFMIASYKRAYQQIVYNKVVKLADDYPDFFQKVDYRMGMEKDRDVIVGVDKDGKKRGVRVNRYIHDVVEQVFDVLNPNWAEQILLVPSKWFTQMTTGMYPLYAPVNLTRDQLTAFVNTKTNFIPIVSSIEMLFTKQGRRYMKEYSRLFGVDNNTLLGALNEIDPSELGKAMSDNKFIASVELLRKFISLPANVSESVTRMAEYVKARIQGKDIRTAKRYADEVSAPFGDRGHWIGKFGQVVVKAIPYFNSTLQVARQALRSVASSKNVYRFLFAVAGLTVAVWASYKNIIDNGTEEDKRTLMNIQAEMLTMYLYLPQNNKEKDGLIRIPIDNVYSFVGTILAMLYGQSKGANYKFSDFVEAGTSMIPEQLNFAVSGAKALEGDFSGFARQVVSGLPHIAKTGVSLITGKRTFPNMTDIEPGYLQNRPAQDRYNERTSEPAKFISKSVLNATKYISDKTGIGDKLALSPMYIDYAIDQLGGRTVRLGGRVVEAIGSDSKDKKDNLGMMTNPFLAVPYFSSGRVLQDFYHDKKLVDQLYVIWDNGIRKLESDELNFVRTHKSWTDAIGKDLQEYGKIKKFVTDNKAELSLDKQEKFDKQLRNIEASIWKKLQKYQNATRKS